jgi:hypothetical protein
MTDIYVPKQRGVQRWYTLPDNFRGTCIPERIVVCPDCRGWMEVGGFERLYCTECGLVIRENKLWVDL